MVMILGKVPTEVHIIITRVESLENSVFVKTEVCERSYSLGSDTHTESSNERNEQDI